ncbi:MAG: glycosyl transferase [Pseudomonadota bacterium]|nr:glycosyl transferase [Pseudomonadota bacterium]
MHQHPVPRIGGLVVWAGFVPVALIASDLPGGLFTWIAWLALLAVSLADDFRSVGAGPRLAVHALAAAIAGWGLLDASADAFTLPLLFLFLAWSANAFNFMDGSDGLAALMTITGFAAYALAGGHQAVACAAIAGAAVPFAIVNRPPARLFMGDCGAVPLGFMAALFGAAGVLSLTWPPWFPVLVFLPFLSDATLTLLRRLARGERVWDAHREHYYQRLHQLGAGHRGTLFVYGVLMVGTCVSALITLRAEPAAGWLVLLAWCAALAVLFLRIDYHWRKLHAPPA